MYKMHRCVHVICGIQSSVRVVVEPPQVLALEGCLVWGMSECLYGSDSSAFSLLVE